jgi:hypothetical protein
VDADDLAAARTALEEARPTGWMVGQPYYHDEAGCWEQYAYDPTERPVNGKRNREWTAVPQTEAGVVRELARCLAEIAEGHWPR